jgi:hypothetical protein
MEKAERPLKPAMCWPSTEDRKLRMAVQANAKRHDLKNQHQDDDCYRSERFAQEDHPIRLPPPRGDVCFPPLAELRRVRPLPTDIVEKVGI